MYQSKNKKAVLRLVREKKFELMRIVNSYVDHRKEVETNYNTLSTLKCWHKRFMKFLYQYNQITVSLSNKGIGADFKVYLEDYGYANKTVKTYLSTLQSIMDKTDTPHLFNLKELFSGYADHYKENEDYFMENEDVFQLINYNPKLHHERVILHRFLVACFVGCRISEIESVEKVSDDVVSYTSLKTKKKVLVPYTKHINHIIEKGTFREKIPSKYEYSNRNTVLHKILKDLKWNEKVKTYQVYQKKKVCIEKPKYQAITFHSARKWFGKMLLDKDVSMYKVSKMLGHTSITTTEKYYASVSKEQMLAESKDVINQIF